MFRSSPHSGHVGFDITMIQQTPFQILLQDVMDNHNKDTPVPHTPPFTGQRTVWPLPPSYEDSSGVAVMETTLGLCIFEPMACNRTKSAPS